MTIKLDRHVYKPSHGPQSVDGISFEDWKKRYRERMAEVSRCNYDATIDVIADDETLRECWMDGIDPADSADEEMSEWSE